MAPPRSLAKQLTPDRLSGLLDRVVSPVTSAAMRSYYSSYYYSKRFHPHHAMLQRALDETVDYITSDMSDAMICNDAFDVLTFASKRVTLDGLFLEFGVVFNKYFNYPNWKQHEFRALAEFCETNRVTYRYRCGAMHEVAVEIVSIDGPSDA